MNHPVDALKQQLQETYVKPCADVREDGVYVNKEYPLCVGEEYCKDSCFWRRFHMLPTDKYRKPQGSGDLFD